MANKKNRQESLPDCHGQTFKVGEGVHWGFNGDSYPGTVLYVSDSGRKVYVSKDEYQVVDDLGGYVEGPRKCVFTTVNRSLEECKVYTLSRHEGAERFRDSRNNSRSGAWALCTGRIYSHNPSY
jgi:hypothetical protein